MSTRKYRSKAEWVEILQQYIHSGLSPIEYCQQKNLDYKYFLKRKRAYDDEQQVCSEHTPFVKVKRPLKQIARTPGTLSLQYHNCQLQITERTDAQWLAQLMQALS